MTLDTPGLRPRPPHSTSVLPLPLLSLSPWTRPLCPPARAPVPVTLQPATMLASNTQEAGPRWPLEPAGCRGCCGLSLSGEEITSPSSQATPFRNFIVKRMVFLGTRKLFHSHVCHQLGPQKLGQTAKRKENIFSEYFI